MDGQDPVVRSRLGFRDGDVGTHSTRTIMLAELRLLFDTLPISATREDYSRAITEDNILGKQTGSTRRLAAQRLRELYGLDMGIPMFRALRRFWATDAEGQPLMAFLCAYARDPLLRATTPAVLDASLGRLVATEELQQVLAKAVSGRFNPSILNKIARNAASSWTQSGHLTGRVNKVRTRSVATASNAAFGMLLGYLEGVRAQRLLGTEWARLLDCGPEQILSLVESASRRGLLTLRRVGDIMEIRFSELLTREEEEMTR